MKHEILAHSPFDALLNAAVDGIIVINERGIIETINSAAAKLFGCRQEEVIGNNVSQLMEEPNQAQHDHYLQSYMTTGVRKMIGIGRKTTGRKKDGSSFPMYLSVGHIEEAGVNRFVGIIRDLTVQEEQAREMEEAELEARQLRERLVHVARISTMGEMATGIAHEINQPLTAIATYAQACQRMLGSESFDTSAIISALDKIDGQARRASKVITGIRQLAKKQPMDCKDHNCVEIISEVVLLAKAYAHEKGILLQLNLLSIDREQQLRIDMVQTQQVLLNLINNAIESMTFDSDFHETEAQIGRKKQPGKFETDQEIERDVLDNIIVISAKVIDETMVEISIVDQGHGLEQIDEGRLFEAFYTTKPSGLGMGLSICQSIVNAQGGKINCSNNKNKGATFSITLPMSIGVNL
ncbi:MAG: two-component system sensor kinase FixL [Candidatus Azotimanducaceae bacterium]